MKRTQFIFTFIFYGLFIQVSLGQVGDPAPDFIGTDTHGETHRLYDYLEDGKTVVLDFFFTDCIPCQFYAPQVNLAYEKYGCNTQDVIFMSINWNDSDAEIIEYEKKYEIEFPSIGGTEGGGNSIVQDYAVLGFPTFYVIDSSKRIVAQVDPPTLQVFDYEFAQLSINPASCDATAVKEEFEKRGELLIYPNPTYGNKAVVRMPSNLIGEVDVEIYDTFGKRYQSQEMIVSSTGDVKVDLLDLPRGTYVLTITSSSGNGETYSTVFVR